jgi:hypothetical protein
VAGSKPAALGHFQDTNRELKAIADLWLIRTLEPLDPPIVKLKSLPKGEDLLQFSKWDND